MLTPLQLAYKSQLKAIRDAVAELARQHYRSLDNYRDADLAQFLEQFAPVRQAGRQQMANAAAAYTARITGSDLVSLSADEVAALPTRGTFSVDSKALTYEDVYGAGFARVWSALSGGQTFDDATSAGEDGVADATATDMQAANWAATDAIGSQNNNVIGYLRVPSGECCGFCLTAASQTYYSADLAELHDKCVCSVEAQTNVAAWDQARQPYLDAYRAHVQPQLAQANTDLGRPKGDAGHQRDLSRMSSMRFTTGDNGMFVPA